MHLAIKFQAALFFHYKGRICLPSNSKGSSESFFFNGKIIALFNQPMLVSAVLTTGSYANHGAPTEHPNFTE